MVLCGISSMQKLNQAITNIDVLLPPVEYIKNILKAICDNLGYAFATVIDVDNTGKGHIIAAHNLPEDYPKRVNSVDAPILSGPAGEAIETGRIVVVRDSSTEPCLLPWYGLAQAYSIKTNLWIPLFRQGKAFGACVLYNTKIREVSNKELLSLEQIGVMVSIAITGNRYLSELVQKTEELKLEIKTRKKAEAELQIAHDVLEERIEERTAELSIANKSLQLFRNLTDQLNDFIFIVDAETSQTLDLNASACLELGYTRQEAIGKTIMDFSTSITSIDLWKAHVERITNKQNLIFESTYRRKNGTIFSVEINTRLVIQDERKLILATIRNITERKLMDKALHESQRKLSIQNRIANVFLTTSDEDMYSGVLDVILDVMESKHGVFGYVDKNGAMFCPSMTKGIWEQCQIPDKDIIFPPESWGGLWGRALTEKRALYSNEGFSVPQGHIPMSKFMTVPIIYQGNVIGIINVANKVANYDANDRDLLEAIINHIAPVLHARLEREYEDSERKKAEHMLKVSETKYSNLVEKGNDGIVILQDGVIKFANTKMVEIVGVSKEECIGASFLEYIAPQYKDFIQTIYARRLSEKDVTSRYEIALISKDCRNITVEVNASLIEFEGKPASMAIIRDITQRKNAETEIHGLKNYLETIIKMSYDGILVIDDKGRFEFGNDALYEILGWSQEELIGEFFMKVFPGDYHDFMFERWEEVKRGEGEPYEAVIVTKNGKRKNILVSHANMEYSYNGKCCAIIKDVTPDIDEYLNIVSEVLNGDLEGLIRNCNKDQPNDWEVE